MGLSLLRLRVVDLLLPRVAIAMGITMVAVGVGVGLLMVLRGRIMVLWLLLWGLLGLLVLRFCFERVEDNDLWDFGVGKDEHLGKDTQPPG